MKRCSLCGETKDMAEFHRNRTVPDGRMRWCKECEASHRHTLKGRITKSRYAQRRYARRGAGRESDLAACRRYAMTESGRQSMIRRSHTRRARKAQVGGILTLTVLNLVSLQGGVCVYCDQPFTDERPPTIDHVIPISRGGMNDDSNVVAACRSCNSSKGSRTAEEFQEVKSATAAR